MHGDRVRGGDALYVADAKSAAVIRVEGHRQTRIASLPPNTILGSNHLAGLAVTPYGTVYAARLGYGRTGAVLQLEPDGDCVAHARMRIVFRVELVGGRAVSRGVIATDLGRPDALCALDHDSLLVTSHDDDTREGSLHRIWLDGRQQVIARGPWQPRGVATDGERAFVSARRAGRVLVFRL